MIFWLDHFDDPVYARYDFLEYINNLVITHVVWPKFQISCFLGNLTLSRNSSVLSTNFLCEISDIKHSLSPINFIVSSDIVFIQWHENHLHTILGNPVFWNMYFWQSWAITFPSALRAKTEWQSFIFDGFKIYR